MPRFLRPLVAILPPLLAGCATAPAEPVGVAPAQSVEAPETAPLDRQNATPALWKLSDEDTTIYLFGTMHVIKPDLAWFDGPVADAFANSDEVMLEIVQPSEAEAAEAVGGSAMLPEGQTLSAMLTPPQREKLVAASQGSGVPMAAIDRMQPWFAATMMTIAYGQKLGYSPASGGEQVLTRAAKENGKPVSGLETFRQQIGFFDSMSSDAQIAFLMATIDAPDAMAADLERMERAWAMGDIVDTAALLNEGFEDNPQVKTLLLDRRNADWARQIDARMDRPGTVFIAVGAGHLAGENSVQDALAKRGLTVERIAY
ncbi:TraB/GumN family protein [Croceicoccus sp. YJ47]|uniref:TraB/GumN family protein n=1 Tax=Croceicoccus sp. YJ47 TaxID=2798724 RepID=UPI0019236032|nr:TraB/GumN family protein [Croceicoccus sp. YJ47]QQN74063.1 TraB/GumN family protein [Croceicoccus sp. YJ47]